MCIYTILLCVMGECLLMFYHIHINSLIQCVSTTGRWHWNQQQVHPQPWCVDQRVIFATQHWPDPSHLLDNQPSEHIHWQCCCCFPCLWLLVWPGWPSLWPLIHLECVSQQGTIWDLWEQCSSHMLWVWLEDMGDLCSLCKLMWNTVDTLWPSQVARCQKWLKLATWDSFSFAWSLPCILKRQHVLKVVVL